MADEVQGFAAMLKAALGDRIDGDPASFLDMLAGDASMEFPFAPPGLPQRLHGRAAVAEHLARLALLIAFERIGPARVAAASDGVTVIEFDAVGRGVETGAAYKQCYISVIETRGGRITCYRDYWNPLVLVQALRGEAVVKRLDLGEVYRD